MTQYTKYIQKKTYPRIGMFVLLFSCFSYLLFFYLRTQSVEDLLRSLENDELLGELRKVRKVLTVLPAIFS